MGDLLHITDELFITFVCIVADGHSSNFFGLDSRALTIMHKVDEAQLVDTGVVLSSEQQDFSTHNQHLALSNKLVGHFHTVSVSDQHISLVAFD
jgi:hypothetical protein